MDAVGAAAGLGREIARQPLRREVGRDAGRIDPGPGRGDRPAVDVGGEHLHRESLPERLHALHQENGEGIGFLAGGAPRRPDANYGVRPPVGKEPRDDLGLEHTEGLRVAEEIGHADQQVAKQRLHLGRCLLQIPDVVAQRVELVDRHAPLDPAVDRARLVLGKIMAGLGAQQDEDLFQRALGLEGRDRVGFGRPAEGVQGIGDQLGGHLGRGQLVVHQPGGEGAAGHAVELGRSGVLRHDHAALALDGAHSQRAIAAGS